jgi:hypothetical protein
MMRTILSASAAFTIFAMNANFGYGQPPIYKLLYSAPTPSSPGAGPLGIFETAPGVFDFLTTQNGPGMGPAIFSLSPDGGSPLRVYSLPSDTNYYPISEALLQASDGRLYSAAFVALKGSFYYSVSAQGQSQQKYPTGTSSSLWMMVAAPTAVYDAFGSVAQQVPQTFGFVKIDQTGKVSLLHELSSSEGVPMGGTKLVLAADGNLYGVGSQGSGGVSPFFIFRLTQSGQYSKLLTFPQEFGGQYASLMAASDGNLYGTFSAYGTNGTGVIYRATLSGGMQPVASFPAPGSNKGMLDPNSLMEASDFALYGSTIHNAIFRYDLATNALTDAYQMNQYNLQGLCDPCALIQGMDGRLYGTAPTGGPGGGAVFSLNFGLTPPTPSIALMVPASASVGQQILLWGSHLLGATSVTFNGVPASTYQVNSSQAVMATVPSGATTGPIKLTTANGQITTKQNFTVQ